MAKSRLAEQRIDIELGLTALCQFAHDGQTLTCADIADVCNCSQQAISNIQLEAMKKLKSKTILMLKNHLQEYE